MQSAFTHDVEQVLPRRLRFPEALEHPVDHGRHAGFGIDQFREKAPGACHPNLGARKGRLRQVGDVGGHQHHGLPAVHRLAAFECASSDVFVLGVGAPDELRDETLEAEDQCLRKVAPHELEHAIHANGIQPEPAVGVDQVTPGLVQHAL